MADVFYAVPLADAAKRALYDRWGATLRAVYPTWADPSAPTAAPSSAAPAPVGSAPTPGAANSFDDSSIKAAVASWIASPAGATAAYGPISEWDTSRVSNMAQLFWKSKTFNADISKWNTASVSQFNQAF